MGKLLEWKFENLMSQFYRLILGVLSNSTLVSSLLSGKVTDDETVKTVVTPIRRVDSAENLGFLATVLEKESVALVTTGNDRDGKIATHHDILEFIAQEKWISLPIITLYQLEIAQVILINLRNKYLSTTALYFRPIE